MNSYYYKPKNQSLEQSINKKFKKGHTKRVEIIFSEINEDINKNKRFPHEKKIDIDYLGVYNN